MTDLSWTQFIPEYLLPTLAVGAVGWVVVRSLFSQATSRATAAIEVTPEILEGVRRDLQRATEEARGARQEAEHARLRAEAAEQAFDVERDLRRGLEDEYHAYRMDARKWVAALVAQLHAAEIAPQAPPKGFNV